MSRTQRLAVGIIGGGQAARSLASRLAYDTDVTLISKSRFSLSNEERLEAALEGYVHEEANNDRLADLCDIVEEDATSVSKVEEKYLVDTTGNDQKMFDKLIVASGS